MGNNPTKSQQLTAMFPQLRIMPEFTVQPSNIYELIYVSKPKTNQIFIIKESTREPYEKYIPKSQNVLRFYQCQKIDSMFYSLYQWLPQSLDKFIQANPQTINKNFAIYIIQILIKIYAMLWRNSEGNGLDIAVDNVRVIRNSSGGVCVKVLPPYVTQCSFSQRKISYRNKIKDLGQVLYSIFNTKQRQIGNNIIGFIVNRIKGFNSVTNSINWQILQREAQTLTPQYQISTQQLNNFKYSNIPTIGKQNRQRSISPLTNQQIKRQAILNYSPIKSNLRPIPYQISTSNVGTPRNVSPQVSRVSNYNPQKTQKPISIVHTNNIRPNSFYCIPNNQNMPLGNVHQGNNSNQVYVNSASQIIIPNLSPTHNTSNFVPIKYQTENHEGKNVNIYQTELIKNQNLQKNKIASHTPQNLTKIQNNFNQKTEPTFNIEMQKNRNQNQSYISGENMIGCPSPMRYFPSPSPDRKDIIKNQSLRNVSNFNPNHIKPPTSLQFQGKPKIVTQQVSQKYKTEEKRKQNIIGLNGIIKPNIIEQKNLLNSQINYKTEIRPHIEIKQNKVKRLNLYPLFQPSSPDLPQIRPKAGVPQLNYIPKTKEDRHVMEEISQNKGSLNLKSQQGDFALKNIIKDNKNAKELLGSSIPLAVDKSSSFGLTISQDSQVGNYDGIYEGCYHPTFSNMKHGVGKLVFPSGGSYQGNFSWNKMDGWGKLFYPSGRLAYEGFWKNSKFQGYGKLFNQSPLHTQFFDYKNFNKIQSENQDGYWKYYEGNMKNDMKEGHGIWVLENGEKYDGEFHQDMIHGVGTFYGKKQSIQGVWENNILIQVIKRFD